ncbi:MAG: hypothetical protein L6R41_001057 [Letrouitia leprolyta]|nr:MAG: hypothetical protein L6R41_001057 [Letrouitia leprolyta]
MDTSHAGRAREFGQNSAATGQASKAVTTKTSDTTFGLSGATAGKTDQYLDSLLLRPSDEIEAELTRCLEAVKAARRHGEDGSPTQVLAEATVFRNTLEAHIREYDAALKQTRDSTSNHSTTLATLEAAYEEKLKELVNVRADENNARSRLDKLSSDHATAKTHLNEMTEKLKITIQEERQLMESMEEERRKMEQSTKILHRRNAALREQNHALERTKDSIVTHSKEHTDHESTYPEPERTTQQGFKQQHHQQSIGNIDALKGTIEQHRADLLVDEEAIERQRQELSRLIQRLRSLTKNEDEASETETEDGEPVEHLAAQGSEVSRLTHRLALLDLRDKKTRTEKSDSGTAQYKRLRERYDLLERYVRDWHAKMLTPTDGDKILMSKVVKALSKHIQSEDEVINHLYSQLGQDRSNLSCLEKLRAVHDKLVAQGDTDATMAQDIAFAYDLISPSTDELPSALFMVSVICRFVKSTAAMLEQGTRKLSEIYASCEETKKLLRKCQGPAPSSHRAEAVHTDAHGNLEDALVAFARELQQSKDQVKKVSIVANLVDRNQLNLEAENDRLRKEASSYQPRIDRLVKALHSAHKQREELLCHIKDLGSRAAEAEVSYNSSQDDVIDTGFQAEESPELGGDFWIALNARGETNSRKRRRESSPGAPSSLSNPRHSRGRNIDTSSSTRLNATAPVRSSDSDVMQLDLEEDAIATTQPPQTDVLQWNLEDIRRNDFTCTIVPQAIVRDIQQQIARWDTLREDWFDGASRGKVKCAERHAIHSKSVLENVNEACSDCTERGRVCVKLGGGKLEPLPVPREKRGQAGPGTVGHWKWTGTS